MSTGSAEEKTDFTSINKLAVSIASHKVQLTKCDNVEEMERICKSIVDMESEILMERKKELKTLQSKKEDLLQRMAALEVSLDDVNREINARIGRYRDAVTSRISRLENEVNGKKGEMETPTIE
jgi:predicted  nucleic acid-binding Zn-ribbon protein